MDGPTAVVHLHWLVRKSMEPIAAFTSRARIAGISSALDASVHHGTKAPPIRIIVPNMLSATDEPLSLVHGSADMGVVEEARRVLLLRAVELVVTRRGVAAVDHNFEDDIFVAMCLHPAILSGRR